MTKGRMMAAVVWGLALAYVPLVAAAQDGASAAGQGKGVKPAACVMLGLTDQQKKQLRDLRMEARERRAELFGKLKELREEGKAELLKPNPDINVLNGLTRDAAELHRQIGDMETQNLLKIKAFLTPEQFGRLLSREFMMGGPGMRPGRWPEGKGPHDMEAGCPPDCPKKADCPMGDGKVGKAGPKGREGCPMHSEEPGE